MSRAARRQSEVVAAEVVAVLTEGMATLQDIWEEIGIPEEQRLERTRVAKKYIKELLDEMVAEEENLKERLLKPPAAVPSPPMAMYPGGAPEH
ncbi:protein regulator of cytokinesis 1-like [Pogoniulus pusillus]|uniref:protein regulator of cytokinesis 1-like n=1 Tax=Pogoniulus pusillus TaxID=488313 RepID=UPI0030B96BC3